MFITPVERFVGLAPDEVRNVASFLLVTGFCERTAEDPSRRIAVVPELFTLTERSADTTELRLTVVTGLSPATRVEEPEIVWRLAPR